MVKENDGETFMQKAEALFFPALAAVVGIGYTVAILANNTLSEVLGSPHSLILLFIFMAIAWFPIRGIFLSLFPEKERGTSADSKTGDK